MVTSATSIFDILDEIWYEVMRLCFGCKLGGVSLEEMFRNVPLVCKTFNVLSIKYVQTIPQKLILFSQPSDFCLISWASLKHVKIGSLTIESHTIHPGILKCIPHFLSKCNTMDLIELNMEKVMSVDMEHCEEMDIQMRKLQLVDSTYPIMCTSNNRKRKKKRRKKLVMDHHYLHSSLASVLYEKDAPVKILKLAVRKDYWPHSILDVFECSLEELTLIIFNNEEENIMLPEYFMTTLSNLKYLKRLRLQVEFPTELNLCSNSLEHVDITQSHCSMKISSINCPKLISLRCHATNIGKSNHDGRTMQYEKEIASDFFKTRQTEISFSPQFRIELV